MIECSYLADPPRVVLDVTGMPAGTATVEVVRIADNGLQAPVRGAGQVSVQDTAAWTVIDWEPPVGRSPVWRASFRNSAGGLLATEVGQVGDLADVVGDVVTDAVGVKTDAAGIPAPDDPDTAWISNPYDPLSAMLVTLMAGSDDDTSHDMDVSLSLPGLRTHLPSAVVGVRGLGGKRTLVVRCWTPDEAQKLEDLLASTTTLLVRSAVIRHRTGCLYMVANEVVEHREWEFLDGQQETTWTLSADEVDPGKIGILVPPWTWAKSRAYVAAQVGKTEATWADRQTVFPLWIDATRGV